MKCVHAACMSNRVSLNIQKTANQTCTLTAFVSSVHQNTIKFAFSSTSLHLSNRISRQMLVRCLTCCPPPRVVDEQNYPPLHKVTAFGWWWVLIPHPASVCPRFMNCRASLSSICAGKSQADLMRRGQNLPELKRREWNQNIKHSNEPLRCSELTRMLRKFSLRSAHDKLSPITRCLSKTET